MTLHAALRLSTAATVRFFYTGTLLIALVAPAAYAVPAPVLVKQIDSTRGGPYWLTAVGDTLFFVAEAIRDNKIYHVLWKSDGSEAGTVRVKEFTGSPRDLTSANGLLFFALDPPDIFTGIAVWRSDGTAAGTVPVTDPVHGPQSDFGLLFGAQNTLFFFAHPTNDVYQRQLWNTDGSVENTLLVADLDHGWRPLGSVVGDLLAFSGDTDSRTTLWRTDGTPEGTRKFADFPAIDGRVYSVVGVGDAVFFAICQGANHCTLWWSDLTSEGTIKLLDFDPDYGCCGFDEWRLFDVIPVGSRVFFVAADDANERLELWTSDGTPSGTVRLTRESGPYIDTSYAKFRTAALNGVFFFPALSGEANRATDLWKSDGTPTGTVPVAVDPVNRPAEMKEVADRLFFSAEDEESGWELWTSDGTEGGTMRLADLNPGPGDSEPETLTEAGGNLFFTAEQSYRDRQLWMVPLADRPAPSTTTTTVTTTTTTTTLPSGDPPCDGVDGLAAVACMLGQGQPSVCAGQHVRGIERRLDQARKLIDQGMSDALHAQRRVRTAIKILKSTAKVMKKKRMSDECATALARIIQDARSGAERWLAGPAPVDPCNDADRLDSCASCNTTPGCRWCHDPANPACRSVSVPCANVDEVCD